MNWQFNSGPVEVNWNEFELRKQTGWIYISEIWILNGSGIKIIGIQISLYNCNV